jgi:hypothetical protein
MNKKSIITTKLALGLLVISLELGLMLVSSRAFAQGYWANEDQMSGRERFSRFDLSFSIAEGGDLRYRCDGDYCDSAFIAPFDFEILAGYRLNRIISLDLALNFSFDYYGYHYYYTDSYHAQSQVFVWTSLRPGVRFFLPTFSHEQVYFRLALPLTIRLTRENESDNLFLPGFLFGVGIEWIWSNFGFFLEGDILPYFVEVYPHYFIVPLEVRLGIVAHF